MEIQWAAPTPPRSAVELMMLNSPPDMCKACSAP